MTSYSLTSDSRHWWWPSAAAGTAGAAAIAAILVLPGAVQAVPQPVAPVEPAGSVFVGEAFDRQTFDRQCFMFRAQWNEGLDGFQPLCSSARSQPPDGVPRPGLSYLP